MNVGDPLCFKLWSCMWGLKLAWDLGYRKIILESEIHNDKPLDHPNARIIVEI